MPRTIGVDSGDALVKVVELDGSYKKPRLLAVHTEPTVAGLPKAGVVATATRAALDGGMKGEVRLGHPCREAVLRTLDLPFRGKDAIRRVVKAEVEGEIHGYAVDDMVVDFLEVEGAPDGGSRVLVAAVPKEGVRANLLALEAAKVAVETVDLDTMALWRAADWAGAFAGAGADTLTAVVDLGGRSTKVLLVAGEELVDMRALRLGELAVADEIAMHHGLPLGEAARAVRECMSSGMPCEVRVAHELPAVADGAADGAEPVPEREAVPDRVVRVQPQEVAAARAGFLQRLRREFVRYLAAAGRGDVAAVWVTGGGADLSGVAEVVGEAFGTAPQPLDLLGGLHHDLDPERAAELGPRLAVAIGLALAPLGGPVGFDLRREDLASTGGFERFKFPLTIALMVGLLALFVYGNRLAAQLTVLEYEIGKTGVDKTGKTVFFGQVYAALQGNWWAQPQNFLLEQSRGKDYRFAELSDDLELTPVEDRVRLLRDKLKQVVAQKQKESGVYEDVSLESGYAVLVRFAEVMNAAEKDLGRYLLTRLELSMKHRTLGFTIAFREEDFRGRFARLEDTLEAEYARTDSPSPFMASDSSKPWWKEEIFKDADKTGVKGAYFDVTLTIKENFDPFGGGATR
jgi:type IV pilus assembly protein PilM